MIQSTLLRCFALDGERMMNALLVVAICFGAIGGLALYADDGKVREAVDE